MVKNMKEEVILNLLDDIKLNINLNLSHKYVFMDGVLMG